MTLRTFQEKKINAHVYSRFDKDCDAGRWWLPPLLPPGRPRVDCGKDDNDERDFAISCPFDADDDAEDGVNDDVKYGAVHSF